MSVARPLGAALLLGGTVLPLAFVATGATAGLGKAMVLALAVPAAGIVLLHPILPLFLMVVFIPLDALANRIFSFLPVSPATALTAATAAAFALRLPQRPRTARLGVDDPVLRWLALFALAAVVSLIFADNRQMATDAMGRISGMMALLLLTVLVIEQHWQMRLVVLGFIGATLFSGAIVIMETILGVRLLSSQEAAVTAAWRGVARSAGASDYNPTAVAIMTGAGTVLALVLLVEWPRHRMLTFATALVGTVSVVLSFARSAALCFTLVTLVWAWRHRRNRYFPLGLMTAVLAVFAALPFVPELYWQRMGTLLNFDADYTLWRRLGYNLIGVELFLEHPLVGVGPGNFPHHYIDSDYRFMPGRTLFSRDLHNMYLGVAVELGLLAFIPFLAMIGTGVLGLRRAIATTRDAEINAFSTALLFTAAGYLLSATFLPSQFHKLTWILIGLTCVQARLARQSGISPLHNVGGGDEARGGRQ